MAERLAKQLLGNQVYVQSAGVRAGSPDPFAVSVMQEGGMDIAKHRPRSLEDIEDTFFDLIISLAPEAHHRALELVRDQSAEVEYWPTLDPTLTQGSRASIMDAYRSVRDGLATKIRQRFG